MLSMPIKENLRFAVYYAPRGRYRLYVLGSQIADKFLYPTDYLIGVIGPEGSGKSTLIKGVFPGLELTNDDEGVNIRRNPIFDFDPEDFFSGHTFHIDVRHELAFHQIHEIVEAISRVVFSNRRVIVEHFDLVYQYLGYNAQIIFGIGEEVRVYRPSILGPSPYKIKEVAETNLIYRLMAHTAEDMVGLVLNKLYGLKRDILHSDVRHGFVIGFSEKPEIELELLEAEVKKLIENNLPVSPLPGDYISIGDEKYYCTGKRIHVKNTSEVKNYRLIKQLKFDPISKQYLLIGFIGEEDIEVMNEYPPLFVDGF